MTRTEFKRLNEFPSALDSAVREKFGEETQCQTEYHFLGDMRHHTTFKDNGKNKAEIEAFIDGYMKGNLELAKRLTEK